MKGQKTGVFSSKTGVEALACFPPCRTLSSLHGFPMISYGVETIHTAFACDNRALLPDNNATEVDQVNKFVCSVIDLEFCHNIVKVAVDL